MQDPILTIHETHITLPSGKQIALDALNRFTPNQELWDLWKASKLEIKRAGVGITKEDGRWQGYVRSGDGGFSYSPADIHAYWRSKAEQIAAGGDCETVIVSRDELASEPVPVPCQQHNDFRVHAKRCRNDTYQIRLHCDRCGKKTQGAIAWDRLGQDLVIRSLAFALQEQRSEEVSELSDIKWV